VSATCSGGTTRLITLKATPSVRLASPRPRTHPPEVVLQAVPHEDDPTVLQKAQLGVRRLERGQVLGAEVGVQVSRLDPRELGQVVDDLLLGGDVVVDEGHPFHRARPPDARYARHRHLRRLDHRHLAVAAQLRFLLVERDELGVHRHQVRLLRELVVRERRERDAPSAPAARYARVLGEHLLGDDASECCQMALRAYLRYRRGYPRLRLHYLPGGVVQDAGDLPVEAEPDRLLRRHRRYAKIIKKIPSVVRALRVRHVRIRYVDQSHHVTLLARRGVVDVAHHGRQVVHFLAVILRLVAAFRRPVAAPLHLLDDQLAVVQRYRDRVGQPVVAAVRVVHGGGGRHVVEAVPEAAARPRAVVAVAARLRRAETVRVDRARHRRRLRVRHFRHDLVHLALPELLVLGAVQARVDRQQLGQRLKHAAMLPVKLSLFRDSPGGSWSAASARTSCTPHTTRGWSAGSATSGPGCRRSSTRRAPARSSGRSSCTRGESTLSSPPACTSGRSASASASRPPTG
jgi:hypothetical protein